MRDELKQLLTEVDNELIPNLSSRIDLDTYVDKIISKSTIVPVFENGVLSAFISFYSNDHTRHAGYLSMIAVKNSCRNKGIAKLLIEYAVNFLRHTGFEYFRLEAQQQNVKAVNLYKKIGFTIFEVRPGIFMMEKKLL